MQLLPLAGMLVVRFAGNRAAALAALGIAAVEAILALYLYLEYDRDSGALQFGEHLGLYGPLDYHAAVDGKAIIGQFDVDVRNAFQVSVRYGPFLQSQRLAQSPTDPGLIPAQSGMDI